MITEDSGVFKKQESDLFIFKKTVLFYGQLLSDSHEVDYWKVTNIY